MNIDNLLFALTMLFFVLTLFIANFRIKRMKSTEDK